MTDRFTTAQRAKVVQRALGQLGKPYEYGADGPDSYDCSGSVVEAWQPFLTLPHNSSALITAPGVRTVARGTKIDSIGRHAADAGHGPLRFPVHWLKLGDLIFFYGSVSHPNTVSHVAVFVGARGTIVEAIVNATGIVDGKNRGVELIEMDAYVEHCGIGYVGH